MKAKATILLSYLTLHFTNLGTGWYAKKYEMAQAEHDLPTESVLFKKLFLGYIFILKQYYGTECKMYMILMHRTSDFKENL